MVYATGMGRRWIVLLVLGAGCAQDLPSLVPLGRGPLAEEETRPARPRPRRAAAASTSARARPGSEPREYATREAVDAGHELGRGDAGPADAPATGRDAGSDAAPVLAGRYRGSDVTIYHLPGFPDRKEFDQNAKSDVEQKSQSLVAITLVDSSNGSPICTLEADLRGERGTLRAGQECFGGDGFSPTLTSGTAHFADGQLTLDLTFDLDQQLGDERVHGQIEYHFEGTRK